MWMDDRNLAPTEARSGAANVLPGYEPVKVSQAQPLLARPK
jgi:hypothetical protein